MSTEFAGQWAVKRRAPRVLPAEQIKVTHLTPSQHRAMHLLMADTPVIYRPTSIMLTKTTLSFHSSDSGKLAKLVEQAIGKARNTNDRGAGNIWHSIARKLAKVGVEVRR